MAKNLWGDLSALAEIRTPKAILQEQAQALTEATNGILVGAIEDRSVRFADNLAYTLEVKIPTLNNYTYTVLSIEHPVEMYPVEVRANKPPTRVSCADEQDFEGALASILGSPEIRNILARLHSQAT